MNLSRRTTSGRYIPEADGIRFVAIMLVLLVHASITAVYVAHGQASGRTGRFDSFHFDMTHWHFGQHLLLQGMYGVHLFFILSGFILTLPFVQGTPSLKAYYKRRLTRLEPPYLIALFVAFALAPIGISHFLAGAFYGHHVIFEHVNPINATFWSLEVEVQFYVLLPLLAQLFRVSNKALRRKLILLCILAVMISQSVLPLRLTDSFAQVAQFFLVGMLLADIYINDRPRVRAVWDFAALGTVLAFIVGADTRWFYFVLPLVGFLFFCSVFWGRRTKAMLSLPFVATTGGMAYSIYLLHLPVMYLLATIIPTVPVLFPLLLIAASLFVGLGFFVAIERPCMDPLWPVRLRRFCAQVLRRSRGSNLEASHSTA